MTTPPDRAPARDRTREDLYHLIRNSREITRSQLAERSGMPRSTVNHAVGRLLADGRIVEVEVRAKGPGSGSGRPAVTLAPVPSRAPVGGIDFGHSHVTVAVADGLGRLLGEERLDLDVDLHAVEALEFAAAALGAARPSALGRQVRRRRGGDPRARGPHGDGALAHHLVELGRPGPGAGARSPARRARPCRERRRPRCLR